MSEREMAKLLALVEKHLGRGWIDIVDWLREQNGLDVIDARLSRGDFTGVVAEIESAARRFAADTHQAFNAAGQRAAQWLDDRVGDRLIRFDAVNDRAVRRAQRNELELVHGLTQEQSTVIRNVMVDAQRAGTNPREWARDIRQSIGLTPSQDAALRSYRRALEAGDYTNALGRELRDGRADRSLAAARRDGKVLSGERIDSLVERYRANLVSWRAETIARTEAQRNVNEGVYELYQQAADRGDVAPGELETVWNSGPRTRYAREDHQHMNGVSVSFGEDFVLPDGTRMKHPGDPRGGAKHNANCRCAGATRFTGRPAAPVPVGFDAGNARVKGGIPERNAIDYDALYAVSSSELRDKLIALPGGGTDKVRMQSIRDAWEQGKELPPVKLAIAENGDIFVTDGRHRLLVAMEDKRRVLAQFDQAARGVEGGTERLVKAAPLRAA